MSDPNVPQGPMNLTVEPVKDPTDRRRVQYWRWTRDGKKLGAVSRRDQGWRALIYRPSDEGPVTELGYHATRKLAEAAIRDWAEQNPEPTAEPGTPTDALESTCRHCDHKIVRSRQTNPWWHLHSALPACAARAGD